MIFTLVLAIQISMPAGLAIQTGRPLSSAYQSLIKDVNSTFTLVFMLLTLTFYVVATVFSFWGYKEFKYSLQQMIRGNAEAEQAIRQ